GVVAQRGERVAGDTDLAAVGAVEAGDQVEQRRLPRARGTHQRDEPSRRHVQRHVLERVHQVDTSVVQARDVADVDHRIGGVCGCESRWSSAFLLPWQWLHSGAVPESQPLPSSTVILLRDAGQGPEPFEVLLRELHGSVSCPGVRAFRGGVVDEGDHEVVGARLPPDEAWAPEGEGDRPPGALPYWVAAVRELFEEVGILLASRDGVPLAGPLSPELAAL